MAEELELELLVLEEPLELVELEGEGLEGSEELEGELVGFAEGSEDDLGAEESEGEAVGELLEDGVGVDFGESDEDGSLWWSSCLGVSGAEGVLGMSG